MRALAVIVVVVFALVAAARWEFAAVLAYIWFALFRPQEFAWGSIDSLRLSAVLFVVVLVRCLAAGRFPDFTHPISRGVIVVLLISAATLLWAHDQSVALRWTGVLFTTCSVALFAVSVADSRAKYIGLLAVVAGSLAFHASKWGVSYLLSGGTSFKSGLGGMYAENNGVSLAIARTLFLSLAVVRVSRKTWVRLGFLASIPLAVVTVIGTQSRGGALGLAAGFVVYLTLTRRKVVALALGGVALAVFLALVPIPASFFGRMETIKTYREVEETSALSRLHFWGVAVDMVRANPLGVGLRNFELMYDQYDSSGGVYGSARAVHSTYFQVLAETGYIGLFAYLCLTGYTFWVAFKVRRRGDDLSYHAANGLIASMAAFAVGGAFGAEFLNDINWYTYALVAGLERVTRQPGREEGGTGAGD